MNSGENGFADAVGFFVCRFLTFVFKSCLVIYLCQVNARSVRT